MMETGFRLLDYFMNAFDLIYDDLYQKVREGKEVKLDKKFMNTLGYTDTILSYLDEKEKTDDDSSLEVLNTLRELQTSITPLINKQELNTYPLNMQELNAIKKGLDIIEKYNWSMILKNKFEIMNSAFFSLNSLFPYFELKLEFNEPIEIGIRINYAIVDFLTSVELLAAENEKYKELLKSVKVLVNNFKSVMMDEENKENLYKLSFEELDLLQKALNEIENFLLSNKMMQEL